MNVHVTLTPHEFYFCAEVGIARRIKAMQRGITGKYGADNGDAKAWAFDIDGACAECALAKHLNVFWSGTVGVLTAPDVGNLQVRSSRRTEASLLLHDGDSDADTFVLATGRDGTFDLRGWIVARDGKVDRYWREVEGRAAYFVPQSALEPMATLLQAGVAA